MTGFTLECFGSIRMILRSATLIEALTENLRLQTQIERTPTKPAVAFTPMRASAIQLAGQSFQDSAHSTLTYANCRSNFTERIAFHS